jgi:hypothetical protein
VHGKRLKIASAELVDPDAPPSDELCGDRVGGLRLVTVQPEGRSVMAFDAFARGAHLEAVERLGR